MVHKLESALGHAFADADLLRTALTHRSHSSGHNERLEFLGDAVLNATIAHLLFEHFPELPEGDLSRLRANLVCQDSLHRLANGLGLGRYLYLGDGELKSGGAARPSILADALEALFGAIWLDAGFEAARTVIGRLYTPMLKASQADGPSKDAKTRLQEFVQSKRLPLPKYELIATSGEAHAQQFRVACLIEALKMRAEGQGGSRRAAEQMAAEGVLTLLEKR